MAAARNISKGNDIPGEAERILIDLCAVGGTSGCVIGQVDVLEVGCVTVGCNGIDAAEAFVVGCEFDDGAWGCCRD